MERIGRCSLIASLGHDPAREKYDSWAFIPFVTDEDFFPALQRAVRDHNINGIYTPNPVVWDVLNKRLAQELPGVRLVNTSPVDEVTAPYAVARQFAASIVENPLHLPDTPLRDLPDAREIAALYHHVEAIPGMCDHEKIRALCAIFRSAPAGDVVEIGSWWGKSAFVLRQLARLNDAGPLLCVDPWKMDFLAQNDAGGLVDSIQVDPDGAFDIFVTNLLPYAQGQMNYLRLPSVEAAVRYKASRDVVSPEFGTVQYSSRIAVLHIDGNHSEPAVRADVAAWCSTVVPGGWIVLDDYVWPYGDGPKQAGDDFLEAHADRIDVSFVMGSALFIKLSEG